MGSWPIQNSSSLSAETDSRGSVDSLNSDSTCYVYDVSTLVDVPRENRVHLVINLLSGVQVVDPDMVIV
jgi:hypothetical protein